MSKRVPYLDVLRLLSIFFVILIHVVSPVFSDVRSTFVTIQFANAFDSLARISVPIFIMISGALLLNTEISIKSIPKRILKVGIPLIFWSIIYLVYVNHWSVMPFDILKSIISIFTSPAMYHLWFVYMIIGIYIILPILKLISIRLLSDQTFAIYFFLLWLFFNSVVVYFPFNLANLMIISDFMAWSGYFLLGYYISEKKVLSNFSKRKLLLIYFLSSFVTFCLTLWFNTTFNPLNEIAYNYFSPNVLIASIAVFLYFKALTISSNYISLFAYISTLIFPVYFMHLLLIAILQGGYLGFIIDQFTIHPIIGILLVSVTTLLLCFLITIIAYKIPYLKRLIG